MRERGRDFNVWDERRKTRRSSSFPLQSHESKIREDEARRKREKKKDFTTSFPSRLHFITTPFYLQVFFFSPQFFWLFTFTFWDEKYNVFLNHIWGFNAVTPFNTIWEYNRLRKNNKGLIRFGRWLLQARGEIWMSWSCKLLSPFYFFLPKLHCSWCVIIVCFHHWFPLDV